MSSASSLHVGSHVTPVYLNLYDLGGCTNACLHTIGLLYYHCAVQAHSAEYGYMGHSYKFTGLYKTSKHDSRFHLYRLRNSIEVGWTWFSEKEIDDIVEDLKLFYLGCDYHVVDKNSIHFVKYLLEQLSNDVQLKHLEPIKILRLPSYIDRIRRLTHTFHFLEIFDTEKDIAEVNILYFLYMKYRGDMKEICQILKCDTLHQLKYSIKLIQQGIQRRNLPIFVAFTTFEMKTAYEYLYIIDQNMSEKSIDNPQLTLTDVFHQFDTITLRGRTSIDRYLNIQQTKQIQVEKNKSITNIQFDNRKRSSIKQNDEQIILPTIHRSSLPQAKSQNQDQTSLSSPCISNIFESDPQSTSIFLNSLLQDLPNSKITNQQRKSYYISHKRKLPRDLKLTDDLYTITNQNSLYYNCTNNDTFIDSNSISCEKIDSNV
ncbi:unnamed protein product [Adineta ricciae]|uniref:PPPDE domain-containing protein n=1 Tax=Adineta ricciae TaxID=249248 RepID=A0A814H413_ADIRI|nr:unnamed protein product [Adineta ricciae]CAF1248892.1 unnamed protein product [Adineta ricciae]